MQTEVVVETLKQYFLDGGSFPSIVPARRFIAELCTSQGLTAISNKQIDELIEASLVRTSKAIISSSSDLLDAFDKLVVLYERQPNLISRTSTSIRQQAYSTPLPIAYLASPLFMIHAQVMEH
jgi:hypothetical protein